MIAQFALPVLHEIKTGSAIGTITILLFISVLLLFQIRREKNLILKQATLWASLNMLLIGGLFIIFELFEFDQYEPPSEFRFVLILAIVPIFTTIMWLEQYYPLNISEFRKKLAKGGLILWMGAITGFLIIDLHIWKDLFDLGLFLVTTVMSIRIVYSILTWEEIPEQMGVYSFTDFTNYRLTGIGVLLLLNPTAYAILRVFWLGELSYIITNASFLSGLLIIVFALVREITGVQQKLNEQYRQLTNEAEVGIISTDKEGNITFYNKTIVQMIGIEGNVVTNETFMELIHKDDYKNVVKFFNETVRTGDLVPQQDVFRIAGKELKWIQVKAASHKSPNNYTFYLWDVTLQKSLAEIKNRFIATTSHELRTPLTILKGYNDFFSLNPNLSEDHVKKILKTSEKNIVRLENLIANVHDLSKIDAQVFKVNRQYVTFHELYSEVHSQLTLLYPDRLFFIDSHQLTDRDLFIDLHRVSQIIFNLVSNAEKHSDKKSIITILLQEEGNANLKITVEDKGVGIPLTIFFRIGQPFIHETTEFSSKGTGLGLYIIMKILEASDGFMEFYTKQDEGSCFAVTIPAY